jgi:uncharacterized protein YjbI with pentapeptide repeats
VPGPDAQCAGADLAGADLSELNLSRANFAGANLAGANLSGARLTRTDLVAANLSGANLHRASAARADFSGSNMRGAQMSDAVLHFADLSWANLTGADMSSIWAEGAYFGNAQIADANFIRAYLRNSDFTNADLSSAKSDSSTTCPDDLPGPCGVARDDDDTDQLEEGSEGYKPWIVRGCEIRPTTSCPGVNWSDHRFERPQFSTRSRANLAHANLERAQMNNTRWPFDVDTSFDDANLQNANMEHMHGTVRLLNNRKDGLRATFVRARLAGASFYQAWLGYGASYKADFRYSDMRNVSLVSARVDYADFSYANLRGANFRWTQFGEFGTKVIFKGTDLSGATWTNGQVCRERSIDKCILASGVIMLDESASEESNQ